MATSQVDIDYSGKKYFLWVDLFNSANKNPVKYEEVVTMLDNHKLLLVDYESSLNGLYLKGSILYRDETSELDKYLDIQTLMCHIYIEEAEEQQNGEVRTYKKTGNKFDHTFFVRNINILNRENNIITYKLDLVGKEWINCIAKTNFTNYDKDPEPIFDIIKKILQNNSLPVSFDVSTKIKINYITKINDSVLSAVSYLLHKLYYYKFYNNEEIDLEENPKFLYYDIKDKTYKIFDVSAKKSLVNMRTLVLSFFNSDSEKYTSQGKQNLATIVKYPKTKSLENDFENLFFDYNYNKNEFKDKDLKRKELTQYKTKFMDFGSGINIPKFQNILDDLKPSDIPGLGGLNFTEYVPYWNNSSNMYYDINETIMTDNALVLNCDGNVITQAGSRVVMNIDRNGTQSYDSGDMAEKKKLELKYKGFEGSWLVAKCRNIIKPMESVYMQNLVVFRNFTFKIQKDKENIL